MSETNTDSVIDTFKEYPIGDMFVELFPEKDIKPKDELSHTADTYPKCEILAKKYICDTYGKKFSYKANLDNHHNLHCQQQNFACNFCEKKFDSKASLDSHSLTHSDLKPFVCDSCHKAFMMPSLLTAHMQVHKVKKFYLLPEEIECDECLSKFRSKRALKIHRNKVHKSKTKEEIQPLCDSETKYEILAEEYICDMYGKKFNYKANLDNHHNLQQQIFACNFCEKKFDSKTSLDSHLFTHSDLEPFVCKYCHKAFMMSSLLKAHMQVHKVKKFYLLPEEIECDECLSKFPSKRSMLMHRNKVHKSKEILSLCDSCHKTYSKHTTLKRHRAMYSEIKKYACGMCQKRFEY